MSAAGGNVPITYKSAETTSPRRGQTPAKPDLQNSISNSYTTQAKLYLLQNLTAENENRRLFGADKIGSLGPLYERPWAGLSNEWKVVVQRRCDKMGGVVAPTTNFLATHLLAEALRKKLVFNCADLDGTTESTY